MAAAFMLSRKPQLITVPEKSRPGRTGLKDDDLIQTVNGKTVNTINDLNRLSRRRGKSLRIGSIRNQQKKPLQSRP